MSSKVLDMVDALERESEHDYKLHDRRNRVWITVNNISVYIVRTDEGVSVDLFPRNEEMNDSIAGCWALFDEADPDDEEVA